MTTNTKRNAMIIGLGAVVACAVCLVPLVVPLLVGVLGVGTIAQGYWVIGGVLAVLAGLYAMRKLGWLKSSGRECCGPE